MNNLDTEIRRAMGELANAAPPAREPESFRRAFDDEEPATAPGASIEYLVPRDPGSGNRGGASRWLLATAATLVVGLVGVVLVMATSDDPSAPITTAPVTTAPTAGLTGDALLDELSGRRWVALERFDDPSPSARTPEFTVTNSDGGASVDGFDGCNTYSGTFELDETSVERTEIASNGVGCDVETLGFGGSIELLPGADTLLLSEVDGSPLARFHDLARLTPATADDMPYTFFGDRLDSVTFVVSNVGFTECTRVGWEASTDGVGVELLETDIDCPIEFGPLNGWLTDITTGGADAFVTPGGLLLANASSTLQLLLPPVAEVDPDGVTLAAGAIFGIEPGAGVSPEDVLDEVVPRLGQPDLDTGWVPLDQLTSDAMDPVFNPCSETQGNYRELWWGDLSFGFWGSGSRTDLQFWNVGDRRLMFSPDTPAPVPTNASGLVTDAGVGVGDPAASIPDTVATAWDWNVGQADRFEPGTLVLVVTVVSANPMSTPSNTAAPYRDGEYLVVDGVVAAFGSDPLSC
jgi:hypothetical protein